MPTKKHVAGFALCGLLLISGLAALGWRAPIHRRLDTAEKRVALTFDDGPNPPYTERILELLHHYRIPATFFFIGRGIELHPLTVKRTIAEGHEIGNHSYWHHHLRYAPPSEIGREIKITDQRIRELGYRGEIPFRPPYGEWLFTAWLSLALSHRAVILYDVAPEPADYLRADPLRIADAMSAKVRPGSILLLHDGEGIRIEAVIAAEELIQRLLARGYRFQTVSELLGEPAGSKSDRPSELAVYPP